ncbi:hypothetical protein VPHD51_0173 [Vibrio phage D51]
MKIDMGRFTCSNTNSGEVVEWDVLHNYIQSLPEGDYLLQVVNRQKGSKKTHDLYTYVGNKLEVFERIGEVDVLARHVWSQDPELTPVVYMSNVRIDQVKGYETLLRVESSKLLMNRNIKARLLSTTKPAYLGMCRDYSTTDLDVPAGERAYAEEKVLELRDDLVGCGYEVAVKTTSGGFHVTVSTACSGEYRMRQALEYHGLSDYKDKSGKDVMSPVPGIQQKDHVVGVL